MLRNRNVLILAGAALAAFLVFLVVGAEERGAVSGEDSGGILGWFGSKDSAGPGESLEAGGGEARDSGARAREARRKLAQRKSAKKKGPPDPNLIQRMAAGVSGLVPSSTPDASQQGILTQSFRGGGRAAPGTVMGGAGETAGGADEAGDADEATEPDPNDPSQCQAPQIQKSVFDLKTHPVMRAGFDIPSKSQFISMGMGERFTVNGGPAFVIFIPQSKRGSAGAIFDDRFLVLIRGTCIPDRQFLKSLLRQ